MLWKIRNPANSKRVAELHSSRSIYFKRTLNISEKFDKEIQLRPTGEKSKSGRCHFNLCGSRRSGKSEVISASEFKEYRK